MKVLLLLIITLGLYGCTQRKEPSVEARRENKLLSYWDTFDFTDTLALQKHEIAEQAVVDFIAALKGSDEELRDEAIKGMLSKAKQHPAAFQYFTRQYEHYLYDPNSPMRNDAYYEPVLEFMLDSCDLGTADKYRFSQRLALARKNTLGSKAIDFSFLLPQTGMTSLYKIESPYTLLFFYEPGCPSCAAAIDQINSDRNLQHLIEQEKITILGIYARGDRKAWQDYQSSIPAAWVNGFDKDGKIIAESLYDLKASPTIYLLDSDKTVRLKDCDLSEVTLTLNTLGI